MTINTNGRKSNYRALYADFTAAEGQTPFLFDSPMFHYLDFLKNIFKINSFHPFREDICQEISSFGFYKILKINLMKINFCRYSFISLLCIRIEYLDLLLNFQSALS